MAFVHWGRTRLLLVRANTDRRNDAAGFTSCCGLVSCSAPLRTRPLDHARGLHYRGPWRLPGPDSHRLAALSLSIGYVITTSTSLLSWRPISWTHPQTAGSGHASRGGSRAVALGRSITHMSTAVINHLHFREAPDSDLLTRAERELVPQARITEGIRGLHIVQVTPDHLILVILGDDAEVLDKFATEVGSLWMEYVVPLLASPPERHLGPL